MIYKPAAKSVVVISSLSNWPPNETTSLHPQTRMVEVSSHLCCVTVIPRNNKEKHYMTICFSALITSSNVEEAMLCVL